MNDSAMTAELLQRLPTAVWTRNADECTLEVSGDWRREGPRVEITGSPPNQFPSHYQAGGLGDYDSTLPAFLLDCLRVIIDAAEDKSKLPALGDLPDNLRGLLELALAVPEESENDLTRHPDTEIAKLGEDSVLVWEGVRDLLDFIGQAVLSLSRLVTGRARFRPTDFCQTLQECGVRALPIVSLISFLMGVILAFVGNVQLSNFGANILVADLVCISMVREMGVVMTAIIMSGRTGAAFAALLGSMKANEEIDALRTFGFNPFDFLVLPRLLALVLMMPILTIYANIVGILGGMLVGYFVHIPPALYWTQTVNSVNLTAVSLGVFKSVFFGAAIAICGCMQGMRADNSSSGVGQATTRAVVAAITSVIVIDSIFAVIFTLLKI